MIVFDWSDFLAPLTPFVLTLSFVIGIGVGWTAEHHLGQHLGNDHLYWSVMTGVVFFLPLSIVRAWEGSDIWERFAATFVLWVVFCLGKWIGSVRR